MTRKKLVTALSIIYIISGLWDIAIFLYPLLGSSTSIEIDVAPLISGVLSLYVGFYLFRFDEFGRKLAVFLLYARVAINSAFIVWAFSQQNEVMRWGLYYLDKRISGVDNPYAFQIFLLVWIIVAILVIMFLSHSETKKIFVSKKTSDSEVMIESIAK